MLTIDHKDGCVDALIATYYRGGSRIFKRGVPLSGIVTSA